jgi:hypothetical protein
MVHQRLVVTAFCSFCGQVVNKNITPLGLDAFRTARRIPITGGIKEQNKGFGITFASFR